MRKEKQQLLLCSLCPGLACPAATGDYKLASGTEGTTNAVYRNDSGILVKYEAGLWFFGSADGSQSYYFAESPQSYHPADASLWQLDDDGVEPVPQVAKAGSSSSSSSATVAETDVVVSGAGESGCNGVYSLVSGTHGTQNAVYLKGQYVVRFDSTYSKWTIRVSHPGLDIPLYSGVTLDASDPWSTDYAVETGTGPVPNVAPGVPASSSSSSSSESSSSVRQTAPSTILVTGWGRYNDPDMPNASASVLCQRYEDNYYDLKDATAEIIIGSGTCSVTIHSINSYYHSVPVMTAKDGTEYPKDGTYPSEAFDDGEITITYIDDSSSASSSEESSSTSLSSSSEESSSSSSSSSSEESSSTSSSSSSEESLSSSSTSSSSSSETSGTPEHKPSSSSDSPEEESSSSSSSSSLALRVPTAFLVKGTGTYSPPNSESYTHNFEEVSYFIYFSTGNGKYGEDGEYADYYYDDFDTSSPTFSSSTIEWEGKWKGEDDEILDNKYCATISKGEHYISIQHIPPSLALDGNYYPTPGTYTRTDDYSIETITITPIWDSPSSDSSNASN